MQYGDCDAAIVQVALHGHHYQKASTIGSKLWLRNGRRVNGIQSFILLTVEFGTTLIFLTSAAIAVYTSNSAFGTSSPIALLIVTALVVFSIARGFTIMFSMATKSFMLNFLRTENAAGLMKAYTEEVPYVAGGKIEHPESPRRRRRCLCQKASRLD